MEAYPHPLGQNSVFIIQFCCVGLVLDAAVVPLLAEAHDHDLYRIFSNCYNVCCKDFVKEHGPYLPFLPIYGHPSEVGPPPAASVDPGNALNDDFRVLGDLVKGRDDLSPPVFDQILRNFNF